MLHWRAKDDSPCFVDELPPAEAPIESARAPRAAGGFESNASASAPIPSSSSSSSPSSSFEEQKQKPQQQQQQQQQQPPPSPGDKPKKSTMEQYLTDIDYYI
jgi:hypothetical protein